ncbi:MAG TPA: PilZ domain-containing protein [Kofleriaceae bacterium]|nr:PilZ domain-containing protein [Kofleriaceae bacterium]
MPELVPFERRCEPRIPVGLPVVEIDQETTYFQYATDLSAGGLFLRGTAPHQIGSQVTILLMLPGDKAPTRVPAEVVGNRDGLGRGTHIKFVAPSESEALERVRAFVRARG